MRIENEKYYRRGKDYPAYNRNGVKMSIVMQGEEVKKWFAKEELKGYPKPSAYVGSLP